MKLKFISSFEELKSNQQQWDSVTRTNPFYSHAWLKNWFQYLGNDLELAVLVALDDDDRWIGIAPWCIDSSNPLGRKIRFLGSGNACSDYLDLICSPFHYRKFCEHSVDWLLDNIGNIETIGRIDVIELEGITMASEQTTYLCELFDVSGLKSHTTELEGGWVVDLPSSWSELNSQFSKSMRRKTKKAVQRLASESTEVRSSDDVSFDDLWTIFVQLHQKRRKTLDQPGCFADAGFEKFLKEATRELIDQTMAELIIIYHEGQPLASMLLLNDDETVYMYQSGMDTDRLNLEPGYQIAYCAIERAIQKQYRRFDFLRGDEPYKARWNTVRTPIVRTRFIPRTKTASFKHNLWLTGRSIKNYVISR